jgi:hypothetical protein
VELGGITDQGVRRAMEQLLITWPHPTALDLGGVHDVHSLHLLQQMAMNR